MTWSGRQLTRMTAYGGMYDYSYTYNDEGIRTTKNINGTIHYYTLEGATILSEQWGTHLLVFLYDESGSPIGLQYRNTSYAEGDFDTFYFEKNVFGDIVGVYTEGGTYIGGYTYDAWGNVTSTTKSGTTTLQQQIVRNYNPFRYRGYYYDTNSSLYYLQSRYYDPATGRFINADGYISTGTGLLGYNMYAYCGNNPVMYVDTTGNLPQLLLFGLVLLITICTVSCSEVLNGGSLENTPADPRGEGPFYDNKEDAIAEAINTIAKKSSASMWQYEYGMSVYEYDGVYYTEILGEGKGSASMCYVPIPISYSDARLVAIIHSHTDPQDYPFKPDHKEGDWQKYYYSFNGQVESYIIDYVRYTDTIRIRYMPVGMEDATRFKYWEGELMP